MKIMKYFGVFAKYKVENSKNVKIVKGYKIQQMRNFQISELS